jgi:hypothetical protein
MCQEGIQDGGVLFHQSLPPQRCPVGQYLITVDVSLQLVQQRRAPAVAGDRVDPGVKPLPEPMGAEVCPERKEDLM